jgi:hypothetical protein
VSVVGVVEEGQEVEEVRDRFVEDAALLLKASHTSSLTFHTLVASGLIH